MHNMFSSDLMVHCLERRDSAAASGLMRDHIMSGADELVRMLEQQGLWNAPQ